MKAKPDKKKRGKRAALVSALAAAVLFVVAAAVWQGLFRYANPLEAYGVPYPFTHNGVVPGEVTVDGQTYVYNRDLVNVLLMGYDETGQRDRQGIGYQADTLALAVINRKTGGVTLVSIPRDTVTDFAVFDFNGNFATVQAGPVALAHAYGTEDGISGDLTMAAVSNLLYQIPVERYFEMNIDGIVPVNDALGGVRLVLMADFTMFNPEMKMGTYYTLMGDEAELYVRARQIPGMSGEDVDRMQRQAQYAAEFVRTLKAEAAEDSGVLGRLMEAADGYAQTNLKMTEMLYLAARLRDAAFGAESIVTIPGHAEAGEISDSVYITDEAALRQLVLDTFFVRK